MGVYEPRVASKMDSLLSKVKQHAGKPLDMTMYVMFFGFDVMGDIGKSHTFSIILAVCLTP